MMKSTKEPLPHRTRFVSDRHPYHVVFTTRPDVPRLHCRQMRELFSHWLKQTTNRYPISASFGVAMPDHIHLIVQTPKAAWALPRAMQFLKARFARAVNQAFGRKGPVFADRYFARKSVGPSA